MARKFDRLVAHAELLEGGTVQYNSPSWVRGMLQQYDPCPIIVLFERVKASPTAEQWAYLWGVVYVEASRETGHTPEELHEIMKSKHLRRKMVFRGTEITTVQGASDLTMNELAEFITNVIQTLAEMGIEVPPADKLYQFREK